MGDAEQRRKRALDDARLLIESGILPFDWEAIGSQIVKDTGLQLVNGTPAELSQEVLIRVGAIAERTRAEWREQDREDVAATKAIAAQARELEKAIRDYSAKFQKNVGNSANKVAGIAEKFEHEVAQADADRDVYLSGNKKDRPPFYEPAYLALVEIFTHYFGADQKPSLGWNNDLGKRGAHTGAFAPFVQAVSDATGEEINLGSLSRARTGANNRTNNIRGLPDL